MSSRKVVFFLLVQMDFHLHISFLLWQSSFHFALLCQFTNNELFRPWSLAFLRMVLHVFLHCSKNPFGFLTFKLWFHHILRFPHHSEKHLQMCAFICISFYWRGCHVDPSGNVVHGIRRAHRYITAHHTQRNEKRSRVTVFTFYFVWSRSSYCFMVRFFDALHNCSWQLE